MSTFPLGGRHLGAGLAALAIATGAVAVLATHEAPEAHATVDSITISGSNWTVGQTYTLSADLSGASFGLLVYWEDNGNPITSPASKVPWPPYHSSTDWTPTTAGQHNITLKQGSSTKSLIVNVSTVATTTTAPPTTTTTVPPTTTTTVPPTTTTTVPPTTTTDPTTTTTVPPTTTTVPPTTTTDPTTTVPPTTTTTVPPTTTTDPTTTTTVPPTTTTDPTTTTAPPTTTTAPPTTTTPAPSGGGTGSANGLPFGL
ncbi:hypothetical protein ACQP06_32855 [Nocardia sp. CA-136227]|uniref:hypothetical protein n=1 Tax=Nocardia sp. CA-136227 TaxID=3239979 RepID=UPI003D970B14